METKSNCWEVLKCGREPNGKNAQEMGICPASTIGSADGINSGKMGGRICWAIAGTMCHGHVSGSFAEKQLTCLSCEVFSMVKDEENSDFHVLLPGQKYEKKL